MAGRQTIPPRLLAAVVLLALPLLLLHRALFFGEALVPADLLSYIAPWSHLHPPTTAWNVLRYDGITQFYPWRLFAARSVQSGHLPLWNPYTFAAAGGAPQLADSQSAPLYPLNALFYLLPPALFPFAFGLLATLQLLIAGTGLYRLLRSLPLRRVAALLGASAFVLSGPIVTWLSLPTFLSVACWIPWLLLTVRTSHLQSGTQTGRRAMIWAVVVTGLMLLGGHLQIALYGLLIAGLYTLTLGIPALRSRRIRPAVWCGAFVGIVAVGILLALPQLLPAVELSRYSSRVGSGDYGSYLTTALPMRNLVTLLFPDFFGNPNPIGTPYWNTNNYAEWALYAGIAPLLLAFVALGLPWKRQAASEAVVAHERAFFAVTALLALLIALGTPLNAILFFGLPGFRQTGNPARILVLFTLSLSVLAAIGLDALLRGDLPRAIRERAALVGIGGPLLLAALGASQAARFAPEIAPGMTLAELLAPIQPSLIVGLVLTILVAGLVLVRAHSDKFGSIAGPVLLALTVADLLAWGFGYNPTVSLDRIYPVTPGIAYLQSHAGPNDTIAPINRHWRIDKAAGPRAAVLPPNALTVYSLHDTSGYDSLFPGVDKIQVRDASSLNGGEAEDPSPQENGNMVFVKRLDTAVALGARFLVLSPDEAPSADQMLSGLKTVYTGEDMVVLESATPRPFDTSVGRAYQPVSFRLGLFGALCALGGLTAGVSGGIVRSRSRDRDGV